MNFRDHWFSAHNCMEYFFWFKSRLHFHAKVGMIPLGGNTVFIRRDLLEHVGGWDEHCLTEDADIGLRLSTLGESIRVVYDAQHVTREETPESVASFIRQRTRWQQGFLQVLRKGTWLALPQLGQRFLAVYTLSYPFFQAFLILLWPLAIIDVLWLKVSARELRRQNNWEKTAHSGAHRQPEIASSSTVEHVLPVLPKRTTPKLALAITKQASIPGSRKHAAPWSTVFQQVIAKAHLM